MSLQWQKEKLKGKREDDGAVFALYLFTFAFLKCRRAGNDFDNLARDGSLTDPIHIQS